MSIQQSETSIIITLTLGSWSSYPRDAWLVNRSNGCSQSWKDWPRCTCDIMVKTLRTPNDTHSINYAMSALKIQVQIRSLYRVQTFEKSQRSWGANVVCLANLASHVITRDLIRQVWYACEKGADYVTTTWRSDNGLTQLELRPFYPNRQVPRHWVKIKWIATSNLLRKYNITSKHQ